MARARTTTSSQWNRQLRNLKHTYGRDMKTLATNHRIRRRTRSEVPKYQAIDQELCIAREDPSVYGQQQIATTAPSVHYVNLLGQTILTFLRLVSAPLHLQTWEGNAPTPTEFGAILRFLVTATPLKAELVPQNPKDSVHGRLPEQEIPETRSAVRLQLGETFDADHIVAGQVVHGLTELQFVVIKTLVKAGKQGLTLPQLKERSGVTHDPNRKLQKLALENPDTWGQVIVTPGRKNAGGYKIRM